jgi:acyl-CoA carboxylase subunit beta
MTPLTSRIDPTSGVFQANQEANLAAVEKLHKMWGKAMAGGGEKYVQRHLARGKLLPRDRVDGLLDEGSPFLELCALAGCHESGKVPGGSTVAGIGWVKDRPVMVTASEATVQGGAIGPIGVQKGNRLGQVAWENELPTIHLIESAGADLPNQTEIFVPGGATFRHITERSKAGMPTISLVFGSCTAGGAYVPGMSDYTVMVREAAYMYLAGPPLVQMAIGETVDDEALGGAEMHSKVSGVSDFLADSELDALRIGRDLVEQIPLRPLGERGKGDPPKFDIDELLGIASADVRVPFDVREVIARLVDGSRFLEFKPSYGNTLVCGWADIGGFRVGILGNNGVLFSESANKGAQFIQLCNQTDTPLLFLQNITGFMVGKAVEEGGIIKNGAKMINAVSNSTVPAITIMIGGSYGAGNYAMCGRSYNPRFMFTWPNHRIAVMGSEQLAGVLELVKRQAAKRKGKEVNEQELAMLKQMLVGKIDHESTCWAATGRLFDDGVIDPRDTRNVLSMCLSIIHQAPFKGTNAWGTFRH